MHSIQEINLSYWKGVFKPNFFTSKIKNLLGQESKTFIHSFIHSVYSCMYVLTYMPWYIQDPSGSREKSIREKNTILQNLNALLTSKADYQIPS